MKTNAPEIATARTIAPEDIQVGDNVALLQVGFEFPTFLWNDSCHDRDTPVRISFRPHQSIGEPLKVLAVCLPFIVVSNTYQRRFAVDIRACRLGRLNADYVRAYKPNNTKKKKKKRKKGKSKGKKK